MSKDRLSIHQDSGGPLTQEAFTIMRDGGTISQSGLIGITNIGYGTGDDPIVPDTILNVQSSGQSDIRFSSGPTVDGSNFFRSSVQILGNGNIRSSGLQITYDPNYDDAFVQDPPVIFQYKHFNVRRCPELTTTDLVFDRIGVEPSYNQFVKYLDKDGNERCGEVQSSVMMNFEDGSSAILSKGYSDCTNCEDGGGDPPPTTVYEIDRSVCGGPTPIVLAKSPTISTFPPDAIVKVLINGVEFCGQIIGQQQNVTTSNTIEAFYNNCTDCNNDVGDPPPAYDVWELHQCTQSEGDNPLPGALGCTCNGATYYVQDNLNLITPNSYVKIAIGGDTENTLCAIAVQTVDQTTTNTTVSVYLTCETCMDTLDDPDDPDPEPCNNLYIYKVAFTTAVNIDSETPVCQYNQEYIDDPNCVLDAAWPPDPLLCCSFSHPNPLSDACEETDPIHAYVNERFLLSDPPEDFQGVYSSAIAVTDKCANACSCTDDGDCTIGVDCEEADGSSDGGTGGTGGGDTGGGGTGGGDGGLPNLFGMIPPDNESSSNNQVVNPGLLDRAVVDFSLIRASGTEGIEVSHIHFTERGYVGLGFTKFDQTRMFEANSPLTINYAAEGHRDSGTIAMKEQASPPVRNGGYGKIYVKPYDKTPHSQALFFLDDTGHETNLIGNLSAGSSKDGLIWGDVNGNTYGGWFTPQLRVFKSSVDHNTLYGYGAGFNLLDPSTNTANCNTMIGYLTGSGITDTSNRNTIVGCSGMTSYYKASNNISLGSNNFNKDVFGGEVNSCIAIGNDLFYNDEPDAGTLAIGYGENPLVTGILTGPNKVFSINSSKLSVSKFDSIMEIDTKTNGSRYSVDFDFIDTDNSDPTPAQNSVNFKFTNDDGTSNTLFTIDPGAIPRVNNPIYANQGFQFAQFNSDLRLQGAIRFQDGTSMSGVSYFNILPSFGTSGVNIVVTNNNENAYVLDYKELKLAGDVVQTSINTDNTFVAVQLDGTNSSNVGKMSLQGLADYITDGQSSIAENCNVIISNPENEVKINAAANSRSVMIGCDVATYATGWKHSVILGSEAGANATTPNNGLTIDTACVFIGHKAGYNCDNVNNTVFLGTNAGYNADGAEGSIMIGSNAGKDALCSRSVGIGENALRDVRNGNSNIEIVAGLDDNERLLYNAGDKSNTLNIQNSIAGKIAGYNNDGPRNISIGDARLSPEAPLEVRRDSGIHNSNPNNFIQSWHNNDQLVGAVESDGSLSGFIVEGLIASNLSAPSNISDNTKVVNLNIYVAGVATGQSVQVTNRNPSFSASAGSYLMAVKIGGEYRPI